MMKGTTEIILTNVETGEVEVHKDENMITNALDKIINIEMAMNHAPNNRILPIATNLLGGIMLFDGDLQEDADNIHFPSNVHIVGYASTDTNTTDKYRGSYNSIESGKTATGFVSVWDFGTTQANGTIKSVARTHRHGGQNPIYYYNGPDYESTDSGNPTTDTYWYPIRYDGEYVYMIKGNSSTHTMRLARVKIPMLKMGVADYSDVARTYEIVGSWSTEVFTYTYYTNRGQSYERQYDVTVYADDPMMYEDGHDGFIYCMSYGPQSGYDTDFNYDICYFTIKYSDESYDKSDTVKLTCGVGSYAYNESYGRFPKREYGHVHQGILYRLANNRKIIYKIPLDNVASYAAYRILSDEDSDYIYNLDYVMSHNGCVWFQVYNYTQSSYVYKDGVLYPDGVYILPEVAYGNTNANHRGSILYDSRCRTADDDLTVWLSQGNTYIYKTWAANYLGTINNLATTITKTAAQTMKIVYTLTDIEDEDEDEGEGDS